MSKSKLTKLFALVFVFVCSIAAFTACGKSAKITLDNETLQLYVNGKDGTIRATLEPASNGAVYEWTIDDDTIASIRPAQSICKVSPKKEGTATVTVTAGKAKATCKINVGADQHVDLLAPSFTYDEATGVITITDPNTEGVGSYRLDFYAEEGAEPVGGVTVKNGEVVDTRRIDKGTYTVRLVAVGKSDLYGDSQPSESTATITVTTAALYDLGQGDVAALEAVGRWAYYAFDWVIVDTEEAYCYDDVVTFKFSNNTSDNIKDYAWITQLIYNHGKTDTSKLYKMQLNIEVPVDCRISMGVNNNLKAVSLHAGENLVTVGFKPVDNANNNLFKIRFAVAGEPFTIKEGTVKVSIVGNILETEEKALSVPSFTYDDESKIITINDDVNNEYDVAYTLGFFENLNDAAAKGTAIVKNSEPVDASSVLSGTYYLRLMAASTGLPYTSSGWTLPNENAVMTVKNAKVDMASGGESAAKGNPDTWYYWFPTSNMGIGPGTTFEYAYIYQHEDGSETIHLSYENAGNYQPLKLFMMRSDINAGDLYNLSFKLESPVAGKITVNGEVIDVIEGVNEISVVRVQPAKNGNTVPCTITIQLGAGSTADVLGFIAGEITISELKITEAEAIPLEQITSFTYSAEKEAVTIVDPNDYENSFPGANVKYELGYFKNGELAKTKIVSNNDGFEHPNLAPGEYTLKLRIVPATALYTAPDWFEPETPITVTIENPNYTENIPSGNTAGAANNPGNWQYYKDGKTNLSEAYLDANGDIHLSYTCTGATNQPIKLFYMSTAIDTDDVYTLSFKINTPKAAAITVNNQKVELEVGENTVSVTRKHPNKTGSDGTRNTITIQLGSGSGTNSVYIEGSIIISEIKLEKVELTPLAAPSFEYDSETKKVTITDTNDTADVKEYHLGIFNAEGICVKEITVKNNATVDFTAQELEAGTYTVKIKAVSKNIVKSDSAWNSSDPEVTVTIEETSPEE